MTPTNDAEKALGEMLILDGMTFSTREESVVIHAAFFAANKETIRTALTKSAKEDGLLNALEIIKKECMSVEAMKAPARSLGSVLFTINDAIQRFNGEV